MRSGRPISIEATMVNSELLCHRVGQFFHVIRHFSKSPDHRPIGPNFSSGVSYVPTYYQDGHEQSQFYAESSASPA